MAFFNGPGGAGDATTDSTSQAILATTKAAEAEASASAAAGSASNAATSATNAANSATAAASSASSVASSVALAADWATKTTGTVNGVEYSAKYYAQSTILYEGAASTSATNAASSASSASTSATNASNSASAASTSATNAASSATSASGSASTATTKASEATSSASAAATSASNASTSATNASNSASAAATSATNASNSASAASTSASNASTSATNAANSATAASTSATNASNSASAASTSATNAANSATSASGSASTASSAATSAANAQSAAETARDQTLAAFDSFDDRYLGSKSTAPTVDNDGNALVAGALYFNTNTNEMKVYDGTQWLNAYASLSGALLATNNLSDLNNTATARTNLNVPTRTGGDASGTWSISITGNAATATNGVVTTGSYSDPSWITSLAGSKISGNISGNADNVTGTVAIVNGGTGATDAATARTNLGLAIGTNVQAYDADLAAIAALSPTADNFIVGNGTAWILETPAQARTSLGATTVGSNLLTLANPSAVTFPRFNADNTVSALARQDAMDALAGAVTSGQYLRGNGTDVVMSAIQAADVPTLNQNTTGSAATLTTARTIQTNLASTSSASFNGSANITPGVTGTLAVANGGTGITSFGTGVATWLGTPSSANLAAAITDETGTGALVFATTPTFVGMRQTRVAMGASDINLNSGNYFTRTISGATTLTVSNIPTTGTAASFILDLTNGGSAAITWWSGVKWAAGTAPTLTSSGRDVLGFFTHDGGTNWNGLVLARDIK